MSQNANSSSFASYHSVPLCEQSLNITVRIFLTVFHFSFIFLFIFEKNWSNFSACIQFFYVLEKFRWFNRKNIEELFI